MKVGTRSASLAIAAVSVTALGLSGCAGSSDSSTGGGGGEIKVGVITDLTGPAAQNNAQVKEGAQARIDALNADGGLDGRKVKLIFGDTASSPQGTLTSAKKLIQQDKVVAILSWTYLFNAAAPYVESQKIPVFGGSWDSAEGWAKHETMFGTQPSAGATVVKSTTWPTIMKEQNVTTLGVVGLANDGGKVATSSTAESAKSNGIEVPYVNQSIAPTDSDFTSVAIAIKKANVNGVYAALPAGQIYALSAALRQQDVKLDMFLGATGYGQSLLNNKTALAGAEGATFQAPYAPAEAQNDATKKMSENLEKYAGITGSYDFAVAGTYLDAESFIAAAEAADGDLTSAGIIKGARTLSSYDAGGLLPGPADWSKPDELSGPGLGYGNCAYYTRLTDGKFEVLTGKPICGTTEKS